MSETRIVNTNSGSVRGSIHHGTKNTVVYVFNCIPYAKAPVGDLRFKAPVKVEPWTDVLDATKPGATAYQCTGLLDDPPPVTRAQTEDCLYVNVHMKAGCDDRKLPVMVMLHGGGFVCGTSNEGAHGPDYILEHDVLYVSVNYRLGVFGFLSIADPEFDIPGNAGLKDQSLALRWVVENCEFFGGDAGNITIMGISAGGASVHYHLISDHSKGLFQRAIVQSGSALNAWSNRPNDDDLNERLARALGWNGNGGDAAMWRTIIAAPAEEIALKEQSIISEAERQAGLLFTYVPTVEPYDNGTVFVDRDLCVMNRTAWSHSIPIVVGGTTGEGYIFYKNVVRNVGMFDDDGYFENALPREVGTIDAVERRRLGAALRRFYYGDVQPTMADLKPYVNLLTEKLFWHGIYEIVKARLANSRSAPTYLYNFDYSSTELTMLQMMMCGQHVDEAIHGEDTLYQFHIPELHDALAADSVEVHLIQTHNELCTSFAATGIPKSKATEKLGWPPITRSAPYQCLNIAKTLSLRELPNAKRIQFWDTLCDN